MDLGTLAALYCRLVKKRNKAGKERNGAQERCDRDPHMLDCGGAGRPDVRSTLASFSEVLFFGTEEGPLSRKSDKHRASGSPC